MAIRFPCAACGKTLSVPEAAAGKKAKCPACGVISPAPASTVAPASAQPPGQPPGQTGQGSRSQPAAGNDRSAAGLPPPPSPPLAPTRVLEPGDPTGLGGLLRELTPGDLLTHAERLAMEEKPDPLAPYLTNWRHFRDRPPVGPRPIPIWILAILIALFGLLRLTQIGRAIFVLYQARGFDAFTELNAITLLLIMVATVGFTALLFSLALLSQSEGGWWFSQTVICCRITTWVIVIYQAAQAAEPMELLIEGTLIAAILLGLATLAYLNYKPVRENFRVSYRAWVGPAVAVPLGIALDSAIRFGLPPLVDYIQRTF